MPDFLEDEIEIQEEYERSRRLGPEQVIGEPFVSLSAALAPVMETALNFRKIGSSCDSPIEEELGAEVLTYFAAKGHALRLCLTLDAKDASDYLILVPQFRWSIYRSDWAILRARPNACGLLIECDGREFHSSAEQRARDARKDTAALSRGHLTIRFSGSLIYRSPKHCAAKIFEAAGL